MTTRQSHALDKVFGLLRRVPETYVARDDVDSRFKEALNSGKHIVVRGDSKQGKTCLRRVTVPDEACILLSCQREWTIADLNKNILRKAGFKVTDVSEALETSGKVTPKVSGKLLGFSVEASSEVGRKRTITQKFTEVEINFTDMNDIVEQLKRYSSKKFIVLDDFHYLTIGVQSSFASALKSVFEDSDYTFIIIGVWKEDNRLVMLNGDLQGRIVEVPVGLWSSSDLRKVINNGEHLLNIKIDEEFKDKVIDSSYGAVYLVQESCKKLCLRYGINETQHGMKKIGSVSDAEVCLKGIYDDHDARYGSFVARFLELKGRSVDRTTVQDYVSIITSILSTHAPNLKEGITFNRILQIKRDKFRPKPGFEETLKTALNELSICQIGIGFSPEILHYDTKSAKLDIVDRGFLFWLNQTDGTALLTSHGYNKRY